MAPFIRHVVDRAPADAIERADGLIPTLAPEVRDRAHGVIEYGRAAPARADGSARSTQRAHDDLLLIQDEKSDIIARAKRANTAPDPAELERAEGRIDRQRRLIASAEATGAADAREATSARDISNRTIIYLAQVSVSGEVLKPRTVRLGRGEPRDLLGVNRAKQDEKRAEVERVRNAGPPISVFKDQARQQLTPNRLPFNLSYHDGQLKIQQAVTTADAEPLLPGRLVTVPDPWPWNVALAGDRILEMVLARIDADHRGDTSLRLAPEEKRRLLGELRAELLELQFEEGALIVAIAGPDALEIPFRQGMDPRAVLGVIGPAPKPV